MEYPNIEQRNADFRALCALTELRDLELPTWLRRCLGKQGIKGRPNEIITDETIEAVFKAFPRADIISILTEATQKLPEEIRTAGARTQPDSSAAALITRVSRGTERVIAPKRLH